LDKLIPEHHFPVFILAFGDATNIEQSQMEPNFILIFSLALFGIHENEPKIETIIHRTKQNEYKFVELPTAKIMTRRRVLTRILSGIERILKASGYRTWLFQQ
jgi:hypothetical protein